MRPGQARRWVLAIALGCAAAGNAWAQAVPIRTLHIESTPAGAEVEVIGGRAGVTPLGISERDIYPNTYADARADLYGVVVLRRTGCAPLRHRVTMSDTQQGLHLQLDCARATASAATVVSAAATALELPPALPVAAKAPDHAAPGASASLPERRLRQLQVLQELLDEGLLNPAEEQRIRRRILQPSMPER